MLNEWYCNQLDQYQRWQHHEYHKDRVTELDATASGRYFFSIKRNSSFDCCLQWTPQFQIIAKRLVIRHRAFVVTKNVILKLVISASA